MTTTNSISSTADVAGVMLSEDQSIRPEAGHITLVFVSRHARSVISGKYLKSPFRSHTRRHGNMSIKLGGTGLLESDIGILSSKRSVARGLNLQCNPGRLAGMIRGLIFGGLSGKLITSPRRSVHCVFTALKLLE